MNQEKAATTSSSSQEQLSPKQWNDILRPYKGADLWRSVWQVVNTVPLFFVMWFLMLRSLDISYFLTIALAFPTGGLMIRMFIFQHDCGHGSFFPSQKANNIFGFFMGIFILTPYGYWRRTHAMHHATSGDLDEREFGDIATITVQEYLARTPGKRFAYRLYRNPVTLFLVGPLYQFVIKHRLPLDFPFSWKREWASVLWTNLAIVAAAIAVGETVGWMNLFLVHTPLLVVTTSIGVWLFYVQHQFEDTYWRRNEDWSYHEAAIAGSSYYKLPKILQWFTGNIGLHHVHHLSSRIPNYRLQQCHDENPELHRVTVLTIRQSLQSARLRLWDETAERLVGYRELRALERDHQQPEAQAA